MKLKVKVSESEYNGLEMQHRLEQYHETLRARLDIIFQAVFIVCNDTKTKLGDYTDVKDFIYNADISKINAILCSGKTGDKLMESIIAETMLYLTWKYPERLLYNISL